MPPRQDLLEEIRQALGQAVSPSLTTHSDLSDIYEGYIFVLLLQAARIEGAQVAFSSIQGGAANQFVFRTSRGYLNSQQQNYGYAEIHFPRCPTLEAHLGVRVAGHSNVLHECDVSVLDQTDAELCRRVMQTLAPRSARVRIAVEAKYYTTALGLHLGRNFLGLVRDLSADNAFFCFQSRSGIGRTAARAQEAAVGPQHCSGKRCPCRPFTRRLSGCLQELQGTYPYMTTSGIPVERTAA